MTRKKTIEERIAECQDDFCKDFLIHHLKVVQEQKALQAKFEEHFEQIQSFTKEEKMKGKYQPWHCAIGDTLQTHTNLYRRIK